MKFKDKNEFRAAVVEALTMEGVFTGSTFIDVREKAGIRVVLAPQVNPSYFQEIRNLHLDLALRTADMIEHVEKKIGALAERLGLVWKDSAPPFTPCYVPIKKGKKK